MARGGRGASSAQARRIIDLSGCISHGEKVNLSILVTAITDRMNDQISDIFDSPPVTPTGRDHEFNWLMFPISNPAPAGAWNKAAPRKKGFQCPKTFGGNHMVSMSTITDDRTQSPQLQELKKEALVSFVKWQTNLLQKLREIEVRDPQAHLGPMGAPRGRGRGAPRGGGGRGLDRNGNGGGRGGGFAPTGLPVPTGPPRLPSKHTDVALAAKYPPIPNSLWTLPQERRKLLLHIVFLAALSLSEYTANTHLLLVNLTSCLNMPLSYLYAEEGRLAKAMAQTALDMSPEEYMQKVEESKGSRRSKGNNTPIPTNLSPALVAAGIGMPEGGFGLTRIVAAGLLGPLAERGRAMCNLFGMNPIRPTSKMIEIFGRDIQEFGFLSAHDADIIEYIDSRQFDATHRRFRLVLAMGGWITEDQDIRKPWSCLGRQTENYVVRWEIATLMGLGGALETVIKSNAWRTSQKQISKKSIFACLLDAEWPASLLKVSKLVDNPWSVGMVRSEKAGTILADAIMRHKFQGDRPVSLVGYGLAARAFYICLMILAERRCFGLVDSVILMGAPIPAESRVWLTMRSVVSGRLVNAYSEHDYLLGFLCRFSNTQFGIAGLQEIHGARGVENHNVGRLTRGHLGYDDMAGQILKDIAWEGLEREPPMRGKPGRSPKW